MLRRFFAFLRRLFNSKGFQRALRIYLGLVIATLIYNLLIYFHAVMDTGASFWDAIRFYISIPFYYLSSVPLYVGLGPGIALGLLWYVNRKKKKEEAAELEAASEEPSVSEASTTPDTPPEEEFIEPPKYNYH